MVLVMHYTWFRGHPIVEATVPWSANVLRNSVILFGMLQAVLFIVSIFSYQSPSAYYTFVAGLFIASDVIIALFDLFILAASILYLRGAVFTGLESRKRRLAIIARFSRRGNEVGLVCGAETDGGGIEERDDWDNNWDA
ncbi:hypothetical protein BC830DRAFT_1078445 [Chytriomyces sp. MP71]|nr:hypothetical protein BC830DRAFT_1078445 [Chytriomyces sp. MP71]